MLTPENIVHDQLKKARKRLGRHRHVNSHLADLPAELKQHSTICACKADPAAAQRRLDVHLHSLEPLEEECIASKHQIEAIMAAMDSRAKVYQLEMAGLDTLVAETEARHERWIDAIYTPSMFEAW